MARQLLFVQGAGAGTYDDWDSKLVSGLARALGPMVDIRYPRMPDEADPRFSDWSAALNDEIGKLGKGAILVGHSIGATILVHSLAQAPPRLAPAGIFLIAAPFFGDGGWPSDEIPADVAFASQLPRCPIHLYQGDADETVPGDHPDLYARAIPWASVHRLAGRDHQLNDDMSEVAADIRAIF
jgi:predicted alpha/beta hydrolase family esterase